MKLSNMHRRRNLWFICNNCLAIRVSRINVDSREGLICPSCGLNGRQRAILLVSQQKLNFKKYFQKQNIVGVSDGLPISMAFKSRFGDRYSNFEFHVEPFLDITQLKPEFESIADVVTCSEVLEHVQPPVDFAFLGLYKLLKPGGWLIFSVPHTRAGSPHIEHFPVMVNSSLIVGDTPILRGTDSEGNQREFGDLVFHGGAGSTLEYRVFSEDSIKENLLASGFVNLEKQGNVRCLGIIWEPWSRVWVAQKPFT